MELEQRGILITPDWEKLRAERQNRDAANRLLVGLKQHQMLAGLRSKYFEESTPDWFIMRVMAALKEEMHLE